MENKDVLIETIKDDTFYEICEHKMWMNMDKDHIFFNRKCIFRTRSELDDYRFRNSLLFFKLPEFEDRFLLFLLGDIDEFDINNPSHGCEKNLRLAYVRVDDYGYDYLEEIKDEQALEAANERINHYLYDKNDISRADYRIMQAMKMLSGCVIE